MLILASCEGSLTADVRQKRLKNPANYMEKVTGIGGFFFRSKNSDALDEWYERHLGIRKVGKEYEDGSWWQDEGPTVFAPEPMDARGMGGPEYSWRINFRVRDLDAMVSQLRAAGITVEVESTIYPNGRFAHLCDPEGNHIELWEPGGTDLNRPPDLPSAQIEQGGGGT